MRRRHDTIRVRKISFILYEVTQIYSLSVSDVPKSMLVVYVLYWMVTVCLVHSPSL